MLTIRRRQHATRNLTAKCAPLAFSLNSSGQLLTHTECPISSRLAYATSSEDIGSFSINRRCPPPAPPFGA